MRALIFALLLPAAALADARTARPLDPLYDRIAADVKAGRPAIIAGYYGMWFTREEDPDRNLNWGMRYGHARMLERARTDPHIRQNYQHWRWRRVHDAVSPQDPKRTMVFHQRITPSRAWRRAGISEPFDAYLVMQAFSSREEAARRMTVNLRRDAGRQLTLDDGRPLDVGAAQVVAYFGHNLFYDYPGFRWDGLEKIEGSPRRPKGIAAVGCNTGRVPGFPALVQDNVFVVLFSRSLMASEGYSTLALADGVLRRLDSAAFVGLADRTYKYFQTLSKPRRVGRPFVSHDHLMYE